MCNQCVINSYSVTSHLDCRAFLIHGLPALIQCDTELNAHHRLYYYTYTMIIYTYTTFRLMLISKAKGKTLYIS